MLRGFERFYFWVQILILNRIYLQLKNSAHVQKLSDSVELRVSEVYVAECPLIVARDVRIPHPHEAHVAAWAAGRLRSSAEAVRRPTAPNLCDLHPEQALKNARAGVGRQIY